MTDKNLHDLAAEVGEKLLARRQMLALAESCTGGWLGQTATAVAGSSRWFERGFVSYSNLAKTQMLDVDPALIAREGAVSQAVVEQMAAGAIAHSAAQWSIAISGVAGPNGGSAKNPVGTVWIGWEGPDHGPRAECFQFSGDRDAVRRASVVAAFGGLLQRLG